MFFPVCTLILYTKNTIIKKFLSVQNNFKNFLAHQNNFDTFHSFHTVSLTCNLHWLYTEPFPAPQVVRPLPLLRSIVLPHLRMGNSADTVAMSKPSCCSHQIATRYMQGNQLFLIVYLYRCFAMRIKIRRCDSQQLYDCVIIFMIRTQNCTGSKHIPCW